MNFFIRSSVFGALIYGIVISPCHADYKDDIGYTKLAAELGGSVPNGAGIVVLQAEAPLTNAMGATDFAPDTANSEFSGKSITIIGTSSVSWHATSVGQIFYGNTTSIASGITDVTALDANLFINGVILNGGSATSAPLSTAAYKVQNHSWVGNAGVDNPMILNRLDYMIHRDNVVSVVGVNNGGADQPLLGASYNSISVGVSSGVHPVVTSGVMRLDIVAPASATSFATPMVSAAAAILLDAGSGDAQESVVIKSLLMAGATKSEFPTWARTDTRPIDSTYGAGELNIDNSYHILTAGEQDSSAVSLVDNTGWNYAAISSGNTDYYYFDVTTTSDLAVSLNWDAVYLPGDGTDYDDMDLSLANLDLKLYQVNDGTFSLGGVMQQSISTDQNVEYLWHTNLAAGRYAVEVNALSGSTDYAVSWQAVPEPSIFGFVILSGLFFSIRRRSGSCERFR